MESASEDPDRSFQMDQESSMELSEQEWDGSDPTMLVSHSAARADDSEHSDMESSGSNPDSDIIAMDQGMDSHNYPVQ